MALIVVLGYCIVIYYVAKLNRRLYPLPNDLEISLGIRKHRRKQAVFRLNPLGSAHEVFCSLTMPVVSTRLLRDYRLRGEITAAGGIGG